MTKAISFVFSLTYQKLPFASYYDNHNGINKFGTWKNT